MMKTLHGMHKRPDLSIEALHHHWFEDHGPIVALAPKMLRYVQHITLPQAYDGTPAPTHDGASMTWFDSAADFWESFASAEWDLQRVDAPNWFASGSAFCIARERPVIDGTGTTVMTKAIFMVARAPGMSVEEFQQRWFEEHGPLAAKLPGVRRLVQNHALPDAYDGPRELTHDGWVECWFDNLDALSEAFASPEAQVSREHGAQLFDRSKTGVVIARERPVVIEPRY